MSINGPGIYSDAGRRLIDAEVSELKARIAELEAERTSWRDEAERLNRALRPQAKLEAEIHDLEAERDRLKAALTEIATTADIGLNIGPVIRMAQAALSGEGVTG